MFYEYFSLSIAVRKMQPYRNTCKCCSLAATYTFNLIEHDFMQQKFRFKGVLIPGTKLLSMCQILKRVKDFCQIRFFSKFLPSTIFTPVWLMCYYIESYDDDRDVTKQILCFTGSEALLGLGLHDYLKIKNSVNSI